MFLIHVTVTPLASRPTLPEGAIGMSCDWCPPQCACYTTSPGQEGYEHCVCGGTNVPPAPPVCADGSYPAWVNGAWRCTPTSIKEKIPLNQGAIGLLLEAVKTCKVPCKHGLSSKCSACLGDILMGGK
jgi:hypothetical protein